MPNYGRTDILFTGPAADVDALKTWLDEISTGAYPAFDFAGIGKVYGDINPARFQSGADLVGYEPGRLGVTVYLIYDLDALWAAKLVAERFPTLHVVARYRAEVEMGNENRIVVQWRDGKELGHQRVVAAYRLAIEFSEDRHRKVFGLVDLSPGTGASRTMEMLQAEETLYGEAQDTAYIMLHSPSDTEGWFSGECYDSFERWVAKGDQVVIFDYEGLTLLTEVDWRYGTFRCKENLTWSNYDQRLPDLIIGQPLAPADDEAQILAAAGSIGNPPVDDSHIAF